ncbi:MAG TPA: YidC/Oxa1 family membrane protein insertase [Ktedonobacterales bacterium]
MGGIAQLFGTLFGPIGTLFHIFFYQPVFNLLMLIYGGLGSFALSVVILTLIIRTCLIPLTRKQLRSSREMQALAPKLNELKAQYRNDPQGMMAAQQALYKEHGVSPMAGCLPLLIQMPFLYALYYSFYTVINAINANHGAGNLNLINKDIYPFLPKLTQLPDLHFFWTNLGHADPMHILPILAAILTLIQLRMAMPVRKKTPGSPQDPTAQATQTTMYIMPAMTLFIGWTFPSGLALYWVITTLFSALQQYFIAGWGSLFVGIPGLEHLVPEPKQPPVLATATTSRAGGAGARALTAPAQTPPAEGGIRGLFKQVRDTMAAAQSQAASQTEARRAEKQGGTGEASAEEKPFGVEREAGASSQARRERRQRPAKAGPILVKPSAQPSGELPEQAIEREGKDTAPVESDVLPEVAIQRDATSNGNKTNGTNGTNGTSGQRTPGKPGGAQAANGARKGGSGGGSGGKSGSSAQRPRGGRPKGSR